MANLDRRTILAGSAALVSASFLWGCVEAADSNDLSAKQQLILERLCDIVIPRTDTPGALDVGVPAFVALALKHGLAGSGDPEAEGAPESNDYGRWLETALPGFLAGDPRSRLDRVVRLDAEAYAPGAAPSPWKRLKELILIGYYTSAAGATRELRYELVPGQYDADLPIGADNRSWASDWTALDFG